MSARETMLQIIPLGMMRLSERGFSVTLDSLVYHVAGQGSLESCTDLELFAMVRALHGYEAFADVKTTAPTGHNVVQIMTVSAREMLQLNNQDAGWLFYRFEYFAEPRALACADEAGLLDALLRLLRLWEASKFPGVDNLSASQARRVR